QQFAAAEATARRGLTIAERLGKQRGIVDWLDNLGNALEPQQKYGEALEPRKRSLELEERLGGFQHLNTAIRLGKLAPPYGHMGQYAKAGPLCQRSLEISEAKLSADHPFVSAGRDFLAFVYMEELGEYAKAEPLFRRSLQIREAKLGPEHPELAASLRNLAF